MVLHAFDHHIPRYIPTRRVLECGRRSLGMPNEHVAVHLHAVAFAPVYKGIRLAEVIPVDRRMQAFPFEFIPSYDEATLTRYNVA
ncbi:MAG: hypothetical protein BWY82_01718 [Verrucomicrobia bacterium ADurb.Bin474]|nr:MAG: hypothetical protein BWY82_01718 [Verrucomicrobia bacterium ADurb.Bin474]